MDCVKKDLALLYEKYFKLLKLFESLHERIKVLEEKEVPALLYREYISKEEAKHIWPDQVTGWKIT